MAEKSVKSFSIGVMIRIGLTILGTLMIAVALLVDLVLSGLSSGIGPLQMTVAALGLALMIIPWLRLTFLGRGAMVLGTLLVMIIILEFALGAAGFTAEYSSPPDFDPNAPVSLQLDPVRVCDAERGCHWNVDLLHSSCAPDSQDRVCRINDYGMTSEYEFTADSLPDDSYRILVLGDSFTWGASADFGQGWVDILERNVQASTPVTVWNAAMPGTGTAQAILTAQNLLPIMQPDLVILGFHSGNDFADNLFPYDRFINVYAEDGSSAVVQQYSLDASNTPLHETDAVIYYRANGYTVSSVKGWQATVNQWLRSTRLGTLLVGAYRVITWDSTHLAPTETLLRELQTVITDSGSQLLVLIIPEQNDSRSPTQKYRGAVTVMGNADVAFVDSLPLLTPAHFENVNYGDKHLNNDGHAIVGQMMTNCVAQIIETANLECSR